MSCCSPSRSRRPAAGLLAALALLVVSGAPASAHAAAAKPPVRALCAGTVTVRDSPRGYAIGHLVRPQRLAVLARDRVRGGGRWALVRALGDDVTGWIPEGALCRPR